MKRLPNENKYQLDIKDQFKNEFEVGQLQGNNFHMTDSADLPMYIEPQGNIEQEVIEAIEGIVVEGSSINVNDVDTNYENSIMPKGNIEQDSRVGYNKCESKLTSLTNNGITITRLSNGKYLLNGTSTGTAGFRIDQTDNGADNLKDYNGTYTLGIRTSSNNNIAVRLIKNEPFEQLASATSITPSTVTIEKTGCFIMINMPSGITLNNEIVEIMLLEGTYTTDTLPPYEQYGSMPSLSFPSEVKGVSGHYDNVVENKNLAKMRLASMDFKTGIIIEGGTANYVSNKIYVDDRIIYFWLDGVARVLNRLAYDKSNNFLGNIGVHTNYTPTSVSGIDVSKIDYIILVAGTTTDLSNLLVNYSNTDTDYIEHQEQQLPIDIPFNMYSGKPYKENGKWYRPIEWYKEKITSSNVVAQNPYGTNCYALSRKYATRVEENKKIVFSNYFKGISYNDKTNGIKDSIYNETANIVIRDTTFTTVEELKTFLDENEVYIVYKLAAPTVEEITDETLIAQLEALQNAEFYDGVTNINSYKSSEDVANMPLEVHYNFITPAPSVERPSEVKGVGGHYDTKIETKNVCPTDFDSWESGDYSSGGGNKIDYASRLRLKELLRVKPNEEYYFNNQYEKIYHWVLRTYDINKKIVASIGAVVNGSFLTIPDNVHYLGVAIYPASGSTAITYETYQELFANGTLKPFICLNSETDKTFTPHQEQTFPIDISKEIFDKNNYGVLDGFYFNTINTSLSYTASCKTIYLECNKNKLYDLTKVSSARFFIGYTTELPTSKTQVYGIIGSDKGDTRFYLKTGVGAKYIVVFLYHEINDTLTFEEILNSLSIREFVPMYSGKPYKENGKWYRDIEWAKLEFTGTESFITSSRTDVKRYYLDRIVESKPVFNSVLTQNVFCNNLKAITSSASDRGELGISNYNTTGFLFNLPLDTEFSTVELFKAKLAELYANGTPMYVIYRLLTPTTEEITDPILIQELEDISRAFSYYPVTNVNSYKPTVNVADLELYVEYFKSNKITNK